MQQYAKDVDPSRLADLKVVEVKFPIAHLASDSRVLADFAAQAKVYGADEATERMALFQWNGKYYEEGFQILRFGNDWIVLNRWSGLGSSGSSGVRATTPDQFNADTGP